MTVISFADFRPPTRYDSKAWSSARIEESASSTGPWDAIDTVPLSPLDADPADPQLRNFTTENGTLVSGWYRVVFIDETGDEAQPSNAVRVGPQDTADIAARADAPIPDRLVGQARWLATIHAARLIELSYFPEQTSDADSAYGSLTDIFNPAIAEFLAAVRLPKYTPLA